MSAAIRQQGVGALKWRFAAKSKENGKQKTPQAKACGVVQMALQFDTGHRWRFDQRSLDEAVGA